MNFEGTTEEHKKYESIPKDPYEALGVTPESTMEQVRRAYRILSRKYHPDLNPENKEKAKEWFMAIAEAYDVITNPKNNRRTNYYFKSQISPADAYKQGGSSGIFSMDEEEKKQQKKIFADRATRAEATEKTEMNYEANLKVKIFDMKEFVDKPKSEVIAYVTKTYGGQYHIPGPRYQRYLLEHRDKVPPELKKTGVWYYFVGSTLPEEYDSVILFGANWTHLGLHYVVCDIGRKSFVPNWGKDERIVLLELSNDKVENLLAEPEVDIQSVHTEEMPFWGEFTGGEIDEVGEYTEPTSEQREKFQKRNERMSEIFENANFQWYLDGAVNISFFRNNQMRDHKDLDISIFKEDIEKLLELLSKQGFGIFIHYEENGKRLVRRVTIEELLTLDKPDLSICKVGQNGKIEKETTDPFNFVDLHIHSKDIEGNTIINYSGATLPKEFFEPVKKELPNGKEINLSQPAIVAYHKLHSERPYDLTDLQRLRPYLQEKDFEMLREALEWEIKETERKVKEKLQEAWDLLSPILKLTRDQKVISDKLLIHPDIEKRKNDKKVSEYVSLISQYISENLEISFDDFLKQSLSILKTREHIEQKLKFIDELEKS